MAHINSDCTELLDDMERVQAIEGVRRGLESMKAGRGRPANEVFAALEEKHPYLRRP